MVGKGRPLKKKGKMGAASVHLSYFCGNTERPATREKRKEKNRGEEERNPLFLIYSL